MEIKELVEIVRKGYQEAVKPRIEQGEYGIAHIEFSNLVFMMETEKEGLILRVHCGASLVASAQLLYLSLEEGDKSGIKSKVRMFETFLAQTKLPLGDSY